MLYEISELVLNRTAVGSNPAESVLFLDDPNSRDSYGVLIKTPSFVRIICSAPALGCGNIRKQNLNAMSHPESPTNNSQMHATIRA